MATPVPEFHAPGEGGAKQWLFRAAGVLLLVLAAWYIYKVLNDVHGIAVKSEPPTMINMLPPPPPPPPPQPRTPDPADKPDPSPQQQAPAPDKQAPAPMQINGPAQAGSDAYGMSSGTGGGMGAPASAGSCVGANCGKAPSGTDRFWGRNVANALEDHIEQTGKVNIDAFVGEFDIWVDDNGTLTKAVLTKSSGNAKLDQTVLGLLQAARGLKPPPPAIRLPQRIKVGRKRF